MSAKKSKTGGKRRGMNLLRTLDAMVSVYDHFADKNDMDVPVTLLDTSTWAATGCAYSADASVSSQGIVLDIERAGATAIFVLAHEFAHVEQMLEGVKMGTRRSKKLELDADMRAERILEEAGFEEIKEE